MYMNAIIPSIVYCCIIKIIIIILLLYYYRMVQLLKVGNKPYVDLTVSFSNDKDEDIPGPPIRYFLS